MDNLLNSLFGFTSLFFWVFGALMLGLIIYFGGYRLLGIASIPDDSIGVVTKKFALFGATTLPDGKIIALNGEAGYQADALAPGLYFAYWPWQYTIQTVKFLTIDPHRLGLLGSLLEAFWWQRYTASGSGAIAADQVECVVDEILLPMVQPAGEAVRV